MSNSSGLNEGALDAHLVAHLPNYAGPYVVSVLSGGQSNPTFLLTGKDQKLVLRKKPDGVLLPSAHAIDREYRVISALKGSAIPVARARYYCDDTSVIGTAFYVMDYVQGRQFMDPSLPGLSPQERGKIWDEFNRVVAALHSIDHKALGLGDYGKPGNYLARQIARWSRQYRASETERIDSIERLIEWLPAHIPASEDTAIVHGDLRIDNLIFHPTEPCILAMLDWELSTLGHPLADLAYHVMSWRLTSAQFRGMAEHDLAELGIPGEAHYLQMYCQRTRRESIDPAAWEFHMAFSIFRLAAILQGIVCRARDGNASGSEALAIGKRARAIADVAWTQVEKLRASALPTGKPFH